jgi:hypothetical protein
MCQSLENQMFRLSHILYNQSFLQTPSFFLLYHKITILSMLFHKVAGSSPEGSEKVAKNKKSKNF